MEIKTFSDLKNYCADMNLSLFEFAQEQEANCHQISIDEFRSIILKTLTVMKETIKKGLVTAETTNGKMGGFDCKKLQDFYAKGPLLFGESAQKILTYALATSEENARMGRIVACPTAGACGIVPSVLISAFEKLNTDIEKQINTLIVAGLIGQIISYKVKPAGAVAGCQAECGTAGAMAAGALAFLYDFDIDTIFNAVALSLKNILGLTCDPVRGFVEVPCIKRNPFIAIHAVAAFEMACSGIVSVIPLDDVIDAMKQTGALMDENLKENSQAGLAKTKAAIMMDKACFTKKYYSEFNN